MDKYNEINSMNVDEGYPRLNFECTFKTSSETDLESPDCQLYSQLYEQFQWNKKNKCFV